MGSFTELLLSQQNFQGVLEMVDDCMGFVIMKNGYSRYESINAEIDYSNYTTCQILICKEIRTVYVLKYQVTGFNLPLSHRDILKHVLFPTYLVKVYDSEEFTEDCDSTVIPIFANAWVALRNIFPALVAEQICEDAFHDWVDFGASTSMTTPLQWNTHFGKYSSTQSSTQSRLEFYQDYFRTNASLKGLLTTADYSIPRRNHEDLVTVHEMRCEYGLYNWYTYRGAFVLGEVTNTVV